MNFAREYLSTCIMKEKYLFNMMELCMVVFQFEICHVPTKSSLNVLHIKIF